MKLIKLVVVSVLITSFFGAALLNSAKSDKEEVGKSYVKDMNKPLEAVFKGNEKELERLYDCSIWSGHTSGCFPKDFNMQIKSISFEDFKKKTGNQLRDESLKVYGDRIRKMVDCCSHSRTPNATLKHYLFLISQDQFRNAGYGVDPATYNMVKILSPKEFLESRHFTLHEYRKLIERIMKEHGNDGSGNEIALVKGQGMQGIQGE